MMDRVYKGIGIVVFYFFVGVGALFLFNLVRELI